MITVGEVISTEIKKGLRFIKGLFLGATGVRISSESMPFGDDSVAPKGFRALRVNVGHVDDSVIIGYINKNQLDSLVAGEKRIYSVDSDGALSTDIILKGDGTMEIGGNVDFMVRYSALEDAFNTLKDDFNSHVHNGVIVSVSGGSGALAVGVSGSSNDPVNSSAADITPAKIAEIKTS